jgi:hypothetical protein
MHSKLKGKPFASITVPHPVTGENMDISPGRDLRIDRFSLDSELADQPGLYAWYAELTSAAKRRWEDAKDREERLRTKITARLFKEDKRRSVTSVKGEASRDLVLRKLSRDTVRAHQVYERLERLLPAIDARGWALQSLAKRRSVEEDQRDSH